MGDTCIRVLRRTAFTAPAVTNTLLVITVEQLIDTLHWRSGELIVRVYANGITGANQACLVAVKNAMVSPDDPQTVFVENPTQAAVTIDNTVTAPAVLTSRFYHSDAPLIGRYVNVLMGWSASGAAPLAGSVTIGVDLVGRDT